MDQITLTVIASQGCEGLNNHQNNAKQTASWGSKYRRPATAMATVLRDKVLQTKHGWDVIESTSDTQHVTEMLSKHGLAPLNHGPLDFKSVELGSQKSPYFSPSAEGVGLPTADLRVLRCLHPKGLHKDIAKAWVGFLCNSKHPHVLQAGWARGQTCKCEPRSVVCWLVPHQGEQPPCLACA